MRASSYKIFTGHLHARMILAPLRLSSVAVSRPRPEVPPVMMTVLPTRLVNTMMIPLVRFLELAMCKYLP